MDIVGILAIIFIFGGGTCVLLAVGPIGRAIADRIRGGKVGAADERVRGLLESHESILEELDGLRSEFADLQERLDFAERLLIRGREDPGRETGDVQN